MSNITVMVRGAYDIQKLRIQMGNRIVANFKAKLGQAPGESESTLDEESRALLARIRGEHKLVTTGVVVELEGDKAQRQEKKIAGLITTLLEKHYKEMTGGKDALPPKARFKGNPIISDYTELCLVDQYKRLESQEARHFRSLEPALLDYPIYTHYLTKVKGIGPAMAGVIISEIDIHKATYPSTLWAYAGLDVASDGRGRSRRKEHLVERHYLDKDKKPATRMGITFDPFLKTKLMGVLSGSFLRLGNPKYAKIYADYKFRLENHAVWKERSKGHRHNAALRYMIKRFLVDLYIAWRELEGLPVAVEYAEAKLGAAPHHGRAAILK